MTSERDYTIEALVTGITVSRGVKTVETDAGTFLVDPSVPAQLGKVELTLRPSPDETKVQLIKAVAR